MTTIANMLLEFLMKLLRDPEAAAAFRSDPDKVLQEAGLGGVCTEDVEAVMPVVFDYAPVRADTSFDRDYSTGGNDSEVGVAVPRPDRDHPGYDHDGPGRRDGDHPRDDDDHAHAVQQLSYVVNNYSYTSWIDDRDTVTDQSVNQNIWADGDVVQLFDNDAVISSGDHAVAAGDDAHVDNSHDESTKTWVDADDGATVVVGDDNFSDEIDNSGSYADRGGSVEDNDTSIDNDGQLAERGGVIHDDDVDLDNSGQIAGGDAVAADRGSTAAGEDATDLDLHNSGQIAGGDATDSHDETHVDLDLDNSGVIAGGDAVQHETDLDLDNSGVIAGGDVVQHETDVDIEDSFTVDDSFTSDDDTLDVDVDHSVNEGEVDL